MKKLLLGALLLLSTMSFSQGLSLHYSTVDTFTIGLSHTTDSRILGVNCSFFVGAQNTASYMPLSSTPDASYTYKDEFTTPHTAIFGTIGHQGDHLSLTMRLGVQNTYKYVRYTKNSAPYYYRQSTPYDLLTGINLGYKVEDDFAFNVGFDNFNKITIGITVYWNKSHHTKHMCKPTTI
jgi:hypothetical protein